MNEPDEIWLQPWCDDCEKNCGVEGRNWCQDDVWGECDECGRKSVKFVRAPKDES
jgi:hypothetical protein